MRLLALLCAVTVSGCAGFPEVEASTSEAARSAPYPAIADIDKLLATGPEDISSADAALSVQGRADALRRKAAALTAP
ncbi:MAG: hypothetical protein ACI9IV_002047 [Paracoccaceae bacterium]|jgi:hypothetical protein